MARAHRNPARSRRNPAGHYCVIPRAASRVLDARARTVAAALAAALAASAGPLAATPSHAEAPASAGSRATPPPMAVGAPAAKSTATAKPAAAPLAAEITGTPIPKPHRPAPAEADFMAALDTALAPLRAADLSSEDAGRLRDAVAAIGKRDLAKGTALAAEIGDPLARKIADWFRLRAGYGDPAEYRAFIDKNPAWPDLGLLQGRLEEALFTQGGSTAAIKAHFAKGQPRTGIGLAALASAHLADGETDKARVLAKRAWRDETIPATLEEGFLARFRSLLEEADHKWRLDRLLMNESRWAGERSQTAAVVRRIIPLLSDAEQRKAQARLAVMLRSADARKLMDALPADAGADWGLVLSRVQMLRRADRNDEAQKLLLSAPVDAASVVSPDDWWEERRANAYDALEAGKAKLAYELVRDAGPLSVNPLKEQTFLAGWLAMRQLRQLAPAEAHFNALRKAADGPLSRAKADYWLGRLAEAKGDTAGAHGHFASAAKERDTFHGQLARQRIEPGNRSIELPPPALPTSDEIAHFTGLEAARAAVLARKSGLDATVTRAFLNGLRRLAESEGEVAMVAHLAESFGDTQSAVRIAKSAVARGQNLHLYAYPVHPFPAYTALRTPPEAAMLLGIARQESEFNTMTVSGAGARGLLQVMPITAKHVCRDYRIKCDIPRLLTDMAYNTSMASAYIADRMDEFRGSYVLTIAGYNAGPGRARQWIRQLGDPRDPKVDVVDWIERIPFQETREYVPKVLSNIQIYRARLGEARTALRLDTDLARARVAASAAPAAPEPVAPAAGTASSN